MGRRASLDLAPGPAADGDHGRHGDGGGARRRSTRSPTPTTAGSRRTGSPTPRSTASSRTSTTASRPTSTRVTTAASSARRTASSPASACRSASIRAGCASRSSTTARRPSAPASSPATSSSPPAAPRSRGASRRTPSPSSRDRPGSDVRLTWLHDGKRIVKQVTRSTVSVPVVASDLRTAEDCRVGVVRLARVHLGRARRGLLRAAPPARARGRGPTSSTCATTAAGSSTRPSSWPARSCEDGPIVTTRGRSVPERTLRATRLAGDPEGAAGRARRPRHRVGLGDRRRRAAGPRPRDGRGHADVRQGRLPAGARAVQRRRARHHRRPVLHAERAQPGRARRRLRRRASAPRSAPPTTRTRRATRPSRARRAWRQPAAREAPRPGPRRAPDEPAGPQVVLLEQRGRFLVGEPFFGRGRRVTVERTRDAAPGRLALLRPLASTGGGSRVATRARIERVLGRPDVARDVIEALMLDRGLRRRFPPGVERAAAEAREAPFEPPFRRDLTALPTFTIDPVTARDFDDAISAERLDGAGEQAWRVWVHIADVSAYVRPGSPVDREAYRRATSVYVPGGRRADAPRGAVQRRLLARRGSRPQRRDRRARAARRPRDQGVLRPLDDPRRRAAGLRPRRPDLRRPRARRAAVGRAPGRRARGRGAPAAPSRGAGRARRRERRARVRLRPPRSRDGHAGDRCRPSPTASSST